MLLHVIPHNCSEMHRNVAIPDYRSLVTQTSGMDICQKGCEFDSLRGLGIVIIGRLHFNNRDRFAIWMGSIGKATEPCQTSGCWHDFWQFLEPWHGRCIARTRRQPNYPNQLAPKWGSQSSLMFDPNPMWWANGGNLSIVQARDTLSRGPYQPIVLASLWWHLWSPAAN